jgi:hypothetical protein
MPPFPRRLTSNSERRGDLRPGDGPLAGSSDQSRLDLAQQLAHKSNIAERCGRGLTNPDTIRVLIREPIDHATMPGVQALPSTSTVLPLAPTSSHICQVNLTPKRL